MPRDWRRSHDPAAAEAETSAEGELCARGQFCSALTIQRNDDGTVEWVPARTPRPFCDPCASAVGHALTALPAAWAMLRLWGLEPGRGGTSGRRTAPGPRLPVAGQADALMRAIAECILSWEERVRDVDGLSDVDRNRLRVPLRREAEDASDIEAVRRFLVPLRKSAGIITGRLSVLLALPPEPMGRPTADGVEFAKLDGTEAGHEILRLHHQARAYLGFTHGRPDYFQGVPCKQCGKMALERAPLPLKPGDEAMWSRCTACASLMTEEQYGAWVTWYAGWAKSAGLACRRCQAGRHAECAWERCDCRVQGHGSAQRVPV